MVLVYTPNSLPPSHLIPPSMLIPWNWAIAPASPGSVTCPGTSQILGTFAAVNGIGCALAVVFGNGAVVKKLTCGRGGGEKNSAMYITWIFQVGLILGANSINGLLTTRSPGLDRRLMPSVEDLMLFYTSRPRLSWIVLGILRYFFKDLYFRAAWQSMFSEFIIQGIGLWYKGIAVAWGCGTGLILPHGLDGNPHKADFLLMSISALLFIINAGSILFQLLVWIWRDSIDRKIGIPFLYFSFILSWVLDWLFMTGYVRLAGNFYCPPNFTIQGVIWTIATVLGIAIGPAVPST